MKLIPLLSLVAALALAPVPGAFAADEKPDAKAQLDEVVGKVRSKLSQGKPSEELLAPELKQFDDILAQHQGEKTDEVAQVLFMKALLFQELLDNEKKAVELLQKLKTEFPETEAAKQAGRMISSIEKQAAMAVGKPFPDFAEKDLEGEDLSLAKYKGKVVLVDFWATWCGPCVAELPHVLEAYKKYHDKGFEIVGISLDSDKQKLTSFIKQKEMPWKQYFDGKGWQNKLAQEYGINSIPATYLLDKDGKIIARNLRGEALKEEVAKALGAPKE